MTVDDRTGPVTTHWRRWQAIRDLLDKHCWSADDDETCGCGWMAPDWRAVAESDDPEVLDMAYRDFAGHQTSVVLAALGFGELS